MLHRKKSKSITPILVFAVSPLLFLFSLNRHCFLSFWSVMPCLFFFVFFSVNSNFMNQASNSQWNNYLPSQSNSQSTLQPSNYSSQTGHQVTTSQSHNMPAPPQSSSQCNKGPQMEGSLGTDCALKSPSGWMAGSERFMSPDR